MLSSASIMTISSFIPCLTCAKEFKSLSALKQHQQDAYHFKEPNEIEWTKSEILFAYFTAYYEEYVLIQRDDQRNARKVVQKELQQILESFPLGEGEGSKMKYNILKIEPAGRTATQTKVHQADEYDFNMIIENENIKTDERTPVYADVIGHAKVNGDLRGISTYCGRDRGQTPPPGYTSVYYVGDVREYVASREMQEMLYSLITHALKKDYRKNVTISPFAHGPAITVNIKPLPPDASHKCKESITHHISVDFSFAIKIKKQEISVGKYGWPRNVTRLCLSSKTIERVLDAGVYLVPKDKFFWYISFTNAAKVLLRSIDSAETCRRMCHKILKADFLSWKSKQSFQGISTFIFKNHLLWFNEEKLEEEYWHLTNIGQCYIDMLRHLVIRLNSHRLPNYFNITDNILSNKSLDVLYRLAVRIEKRIEQLENIYVPPAE